MKFYSKTYITVIVMVQDIFMTLNFKEVDLLMFLQIVSTIFFYAYVSVVIYKFK